MGLPGALLVLFIALKLTGMIAWSWLWVLSPLWIAALVVIALFAFAGILTAVAIKKKK